MLREGTREAVRSGNGGHVSSPSGESAWPSSAGFFMADVDSGEDHLSIELNSLLAMLDDNPDSSRISQDDFQDNLIEGNCQASPPEDGASEAPFMTFQPAEELESSRGSSLDHSKRPSLMESSGLVPFHDCRTKSNDINPYNLRLIDASLNASSAPDSFLLSTSKNEDDYRVDNGAFISSSRFHQQAESTDSPLFMSMEFSGCGDSRDIHTPDSLNNLDLCQSASYSSDDPDSVSASLLNMEFDNDGDKEWTWNHMNGSPVNMDFPDFFVGFSAEISSKSFLPGQLSQPLASCKDKPMINFKGNANYLGNKPSPQGETFSRPMLESYSDSSLSEMPCSGMKNIEGRGLRYSQAKDSLSPCLPTLSLSSLPDSCQFIQNKKQRYQTESAKTDELMHTLWPCRSVEGFRQRLPGDQSGRITGVEEDPEVCIIDDITHVNPSTSRLASEISQIGPPRYGISSAYQPRVTSSGLQSNDDKLAFKIALQDLAQPKLEANPPEGVLTVPLLRHQRIALSWMVQKETLNHYCSGGILADDQGLGKTVSTIALILMERSPASKTGSSPAKGEVQALNLDEDDELVSPIGLKRKNESTQTNESTQSVFQQGRPAAGTLVVCPTSVLRQWADELKHKVTSKANLSFLVYHGSNRTRDPDELAKYDIVLTTYSIVSMEVPAAKSNGDEGDVKRGGSSIEPFPGGEKKNSSSKRKSLKMEDSAVHSSARPLGKVGWFRVILDEAQTIKNHRTQVARACWGLRAKRRWCLSGTPIQNAIDDLYSYFRFLRYEPFAAYPSFCSRIKFPINRNPHVGYRKLQAVLKTVMLRRTKGTLLDGKPIINLPPRTIKLKKVDFSKEERDFYSKLEAESREKFKGYADAGTVKQNYVNILLMLLRLRQACDHPLLVRGYDSSSTWKSSIEMAKRIPRDKQIQLLNCLESSLALCALCNDPPEDSVVTICGHVFCNQCISENLNGDQDNCPSIKCKTKLTGASVFSKTTLKTCLSGHLESTEMADPLVFNVPSESSKIRAAVEILQSLPTYYEPSGLLSTDENDIKCGSKKSELSKREKAIVFSQWTRMLDLLEDKLKSSFIHYRRLDGTMSVAARDKAVKDFNTLPEVTVMIMSLKAASLGLNMVAACHVLLLDLWWNPTTEDQAIDRAHRIGQTRPVIVSRLTVENTVEDRILALQEKKREMVASAFGEDGSGSHQSRLTLEDLSYLFRV